MKQNERKSTSHRVEVYSGAKTLGYVIFVSFSSDLIVYIWLLKFEL